MACSKCQGKGYIEDVIGIHGAWRPIVKICKGCNDLTAYSRRIQELRGFTPDEPPPPPKCAA